MLDLLIAQGSLVLLFVALVVAGFGVPLPEDVVLLAAGALAHRGVVPLPAAVAVCMSGVLVGDVLLFTTARRLGSALLERPWFKRLLPPARRAFVEALFERRGPAVIFVARHLAGLRAPVFATAGMHGMPLGRFLLWDSLGLCVSAPLVLSLGWWSSAHLELARRGLGRLQDWALLAVAAGLIGYAAYVAWQRRAGRAQQAATRPSDRPR